HTRVKCDWSSDVCSSDLTHSHTLTHIKDILKIYWLRSSRGPTNTPAPSAPAALQTRDTHTHILELLCVWLSCLLLIHDVILSNATPHKRNLCRSGTFIFYLY